MSNPQLDQILEQIIQIASGNLKARGIISERRNDLDAVIVGLNMLAEELNASITDLRLTKDYLEKIFNSISSSLIDVRPDEKINNVNQATLDLLGYEKQELIGSSIWGIIRDEQGVSFNSEFQKGINKNKELIYLSKDGRKIPVISSCSLLHDEEGQIKGYIWAAQDITKMKQAEELLRDREKELETKSINLEEVNTALRVLLKRVEEDKKELEEKILLNIKVMVDPYLEKLLQTNLNSRQKAYIEILQSNLIDIASPFTHRLNSHYHGLTPREMDVAILVKQAKTNKEIANLMNISVRTVEIHRERVRAKLGIKGRKTNLRAHLSSFQ